LRILVTGVAGFIGMHLARRLLDAGHAVVGLDNLSACCTERVPRFVAWYRDFGSDREPQAMGARP